VKSMRRRQILEQMRRVDRSVVMTTTVVMSSYRPLPEPPTFVSRAAKAVKTLKSRTPAKLYIYETLLKWLSGSDHCPHPRLWYNRRSAPHWGMPRGRCSRQQGRRLACRHRPAGLLLLTVSRRAVATLRLCVDGRFRGDRPCAGAPLPHAALRLCRMSRAPSGEGWLARGWRVAAAGPTRPAHDGQAPHAHSSGGASPRVAGRPEGRRTP
jgi:hypothetical protein